jgi:hypothetical protein
MPSSLRSTTSSAPAGDAASVAQPLRIVDRSGQPAAPVWQGSTGGVAAETGPARWSGRHNHLFTPLVEVGEGEGLRGRHVPTVWRRPLAVPTT